MDERTASTMAEIEPASASRTSTVLTSTAFGRPVARSRPRISTVSSGSIGAAEPVSKLFPQAHDAEAIETGRSLLGRRKGVRQVEVWHGQRRLVSFERVV